MGFEPTRAEPNGLAVHRLNHSATSSCHGRTVEFLPWMREVPCSKPGWVGKISPGHIMLRRSTRLVSHHFVTFSPYFLLHSVRFAHMLKILYVAEGGFDPPTSGLWAQHASSAPLCWRLFETLFIFVNFYIITTVMRENVPKNVALFISIFGVNLIQFLQWILVPS